MTRASRVLPAAAFALLFALGATGCAPADEDTESTASATASASECAAGSLPTTKSGTLTIGTDKPAYEPWFSDDDPTNGKGFESAVAYAVAEELGYAKDKVTWVTVPFNNAIAPGKKTFDFDINQVSISDERKNAVDFSSGYYDVRQSIIALKSSPAAKATSVADLKKYRLGAQVGTTSLDVINDVIKPTTKVSVYQKNDLAKTALKNGQVDAIVVDLPTAFYITGAEITDATVVGQFENTVGTPEQFGLVLDKGSKLTTCVTGAVDALRKDGTLASIEQEWLSKATNAPVLK
ncbi:ABC transporter substrate-binding protein [Cryptosporangium aurantiacum]|uniref:Amino acid ABC transporter substrate-binding protein, PAAT family n=1 Tax=Cryptosporangium aurantiacum TaxID=134849 RepID=A0A1M7RML3_9ACTN|nr:ABC transporter substrate-binding protein [Cryptosporangium aurantiacum]SHN47431.1 amino acid ABC transporter substrate-binding protein, PAAT family [Cryptosporangium aurantiacum]